MLGGQAWSADHVTLDEALVLPEGTSRTVQILAGPVADGGLPCEIWALAADDDRPHAWRRHATASVCTLAAESAAPPLALEAIRARCVEAMAPAALYDEMRERGIEHGGVLRSVARVWRAGGEALAEIRMPDELDTEPYGIHPALLDACLQPIGAALAGRPASYVPVAIDRVEQHARPGRRCWSHARVRGEGAAGGAVVADVSIVDDGGVRLVTLAGVRLVPVGRDALQRLSAGRVRDLLYAVKWELLPLTAGEPGALPGAVAVATAVTPELARVQGHAGLAAYDAMTPELEAVAADYVVAALARLGWSPAAGERVSADALAARIGALPRYRKLLGRFLEILGEIGVVRRTGQEWTVVDRLPSSAPGPRLEALRRRHPEASAELTLTERCGGALAEVLVGGADPLELLFPGGSTAVAEALYTDSPPARACGQLVAATVAAACAGLAPRRRLRVLEVGGGTGGTTAAVLPVLPADDTDYLFTDVSPAFTSRAAERFRDRPFVRTQPLDLERDPLEQGLRARSFDLILAANVVHATRDLQRTLAHCLSLLAPGGLLVLLEVTAAQRWIDVTFGLTDGWWHFTDHELRTDSPLLSPSRWRSVLAGLGVPEASTVPATPAIGGTFAANTVIVASAPREAAASPWLVLADRTGLGEALAAALERRGEPVVLATATAGMAGGPLGARRWSMGAGGREDIARVVAEGAGADGRWRGVVHCAALDAPADGRGADVDTAQRASCGSLLFLTQALTGGGRVAAPALTIVTRGAQAVDEGPVAVAQAPVLGLARTIALEHPELRTRCLDLDPADGPAAADLVAAELLAGDTESEVAYRHGVRHVARLTRLAAERREAASEDALRVVTATPGVLDSLELRPQARRPPGSGEVEIEVKAIGLNFKDVLSGLGLYPGDPGPLGSECAGVVTAVGPGVEGLAPGAPVVAVAAGSFATHVTAPAALVVPKPPDWTFEEAASVPVAFVTAWYCLRSLANVRAGERVLIHAAAGGVGLAAVQVARAMGAEVFATAGTPAKREHVAALGARLVLDSRTAAFADEILAATDGHGVDVVLNSLSGEAIAESLRALAPRGRFLEIGKRGVWTAAEVARLRPGASYHVIDWGEVAAVSPAAIRTVLLDVVAACRDGALTPLPRRTFSLDRVPDAFRHMAQARHIGKVVVTVPSRSGGRALPAIRPDASYLITGGLGGLGIEVARWLTHRGARALALVGRRAPDAATLAAVESFRADGTEVRVLQADVSVAGEVARVLGDVRATMPPLRGVFHAAGSLADGLLPQQDWPRFARVMGAKVAGAGALHALTQGDPLDYFVLFSSIASLLGAPGQGNHAAANAYLDALAHQRRAAGLPGLSVNWGAWAEVGAVARDDRERRIRLQGVGVMTPVEGIAALECALESGQAQVAAAVIDWERLRGRRAGAAAHSLLTDVLGVAAAPVAPAGPGLRQRLAEAPAARRAPLLAAHVAARVTRVLGLADGSLDLHRPLNEMGLDSLMAVELRNQLKMDLKLGTPLTATLVFDHPTVEAIAEFLVGDVLALTPAPEPATPELAPVDAIGHIEQLSDDEVDRLFAARLREPSA